MTMPGNKPINVALNVLNLKTKQKKLENFSDFIPFHIANKSEILNLWFPSKNGWLTCSHSSSHIKLRWQFMNDRILYSGGIFFRFLLCLLLFLSFI